MSFQRRRINSGQVAGVEAIGIVDAGAHLVAAFASRAGQATLEAHPDTIEVLPMGKGLVCTLSKGANAEVAPAECEPFAGKKVMVAVHGGETVEATLDWLGYHRARGFDGALIVSPDSGFVDALEGAVPQGVAVVCVDVDGDAPVFELLRYRFLAEARVVAFLNIADLLVASKPSVFELCAAHSGEVVALSGAETYPWRLRQGRPAPHRDHVNKRRGEKRVLNSWCANPKALPEGCIWQPVRPLGAVVAAETGGFLRAMGVVHPGRPVNELVDKSELQEAPDLVALMTKRFRADPLRMPTTVIAPRAVDPAITVVTAMRNEGPFILDWIAHNRVLGVNQHLVYTNECTDGTDHLLECLTPAGVIRRDNPYRQTGQVPQHAAFRAAEAEACVTQADWLMTLDVDEYINIHAGAGRLSDLLAAAPEAHVFSMPWRLFGNGHLHGFDDRPVSAQFTHCAPEFMPRPYQAWAFKSLFRNAGLFRRLGVHRPKGVSPATRDALNWVDGSGREMPASVWRSAWRMSPATYGYDLVTLNHYAVRSAESFLVKRARGRANHVDRAQDAAYWFRMNHNVVEDRSIARLADEVAVEKAALLALPGVAAAHDACVAQHRQQISALRETDEYAQFYDEITSPKMEKLSQMTPHFGMQVFIEGPQVIPDEILDKEPGDPFFLRLNRRGATI